MVIVLMDLMIYLRAIVLILPKYWWILMLSLFQDVINGMSIHMRILILRDVGVSFVRTITGKVTGRLKFIQKILSYMKCMSEALPNMIPAGLNTRVLMPV